mmetsp:Transcript_92999/g.247020  ORF Transcript_92999/g.247020 Transcript_92999/m.247020 type:complete len:237 (-) Transcript_92999:275-985(-)
MGVAGGTSLFTSTIAGMLCMIAALLVERMPCGGTAGSTRLPLLPEPPNARLSAAPLAGAPAPRSASGGGCAKAAGRAETAHSSLRRAASEAMGCEFGSLSLATERASWYSSSCMPRLGCRSCVEWPGEPPPAPANGSSSMASATRAAHCKLRASVAMASTPGSPGSQSLTHARMLPRLNWASLMTSTASMCLPALDSSPAKFRRARDASTASAGCECSRPWHILTARSISLMALPG